MIKKPLSHLIVKVFIGLFLFSFLILIVFQLPQASTVGIIADNTVESGHSTDLKSINPSSTTISSIDDKSASTFTTKTISEITYEITIPTTTKGVSNPTLFAVSDTKGNNALSNSNFKKSESPQKAPGQTHVISLTKPVIVAVTKPMTFPVTKPVTIPATKPVTKPATKPVTIPATKPVTVPATKPVTIPATKPVTIPATKPVTIPATKPVTIPATKPVTTPVTKPVVTQAPVTAAPVTKPVEVYYRVTYIIDGETVKAEKVLENGSGKPPVIPEKSGYTIDGWNKSVSKVTCDLTVTAIYTKKVETMPAGADEVFYVKTSSGTVKVYGTIDEADSKAAFTLVNDYRVANGLSPLKWNDQFFQAAKQRAAECTISFSHTRPNGLSPVSVDTSIRITGENLAMGYSTPTRFFDAMRNSSGHNANLLKASYKLGAIAVYKFDGYVFWAELFGY